MTMLRIVFLLLSFAAAQLCFAADQSRRHVTLEEVKSEPNLEKRSQKALDFAAHALDQARKLSSGGGSMGELEALLKDVVDGVELSLKSLRDTGKKPSKLSRQYKRGELKSREMLRLLENLVLALSFDSRPPAEAARDKINGLHEEFLLAVMTGK